MPYRQTVTYIVPVVLSLASDCLSRLEGDERTSFSEEVIREVSSKVFGGRMPRVLESVLSLWPFFTSRSPAGDLRIQH